MRGTIVCGVSDSAEGRRALELATELSERLALRLVLAHIADGFPPLAANDERSETVTARARREGAARLVARLAAEHGIAGRTEQRSAVGDAAALLAQIAIEEGADMIVVGSRGRGRLRRGVGSSLARQLETATCVPVVIAPPRTQRARTVVA